jgi:hypothetical protein
MKSYSPATVTTTIVLQILGVLGVSPIATALDFPGPAPGKAEVRADGDFVHLENAVLHVQWRVAGGSLRLAKIEDKLAGKTVTPAQAECFQLSLADTPLPGPRVLRASDLRVVGTPCIEAIAADGKSLRLADRQAGRAIRLDLVSADGAVAVSWRAVLRDGSNYIRQSIACEARREELELREVVLWDLAVPGAEVRGVVDGSPVVAGGLFFAAEDPMAGAHLVEGGKPGQFRCSRTVNDRLRLGIPREFRSLVGVAPCGQVRRGFLYYLERERAQPYRQFLHYNNGSEIGCEYWRAKRYGSPEQFQQFRARQEQQWLCDIRAFGRELTEKRGVRLESFVHDHGWDDETLVWQFHAGYPEGFTPARQTAEQYGAHVGVWFSPAGGYSGRKSRVENGQQQGFEVSRHGLSLAGPRYYGRFREACMGMIAKYDVNYFKFDGFGAGNNQPGAGAMASDVEALLRLIAELRRSKPDVFVNPSTGSWPSPFWLLHCDCIWRQGSDTGIVGKGSERQRWITYRDSQILRGTLERGPLYPMSSLMIHGIFINDLPLFGNPYDPKSTRPTRDPEEITAEVRSFFATGVNLQELYVNPRMMSARLWDVLAEAARWSRANAAVMADAHWIGGDPAQNEVYGYAAWTPRKAVLTLRNPDERAVRFALDVERAFELPPGAPRHYRLTSPWADDAAKAAIDVRAGQPRIIALGPFETLVLDATPVK